MSNDNPSTAINNNVQYKDISDIFRIERAKFLSNNRFAKILADIGISPVFENKANLKKLLVRTKVV